MPAWVQLDGASNVRDVGGLRASDRVVRSGVLLRSDHLDAASAQDMAVLAGDRGVRGVIDLRVEFEDPEPPPWAAHGVAVLPLPLFDLSGTTDRSAFRGNAAESYAAMLELASDSLVEILRFVVSTDGAVLIHCAAGKDRTGIAVAFLLALAGVDQLDIVADYLATDERLHLVRAQLAGRPGYAGMAASPLLTEAMTAAPIERVLQVLARHPGGVSGYVLQHGGSLHDVQRWRERVLTPAGSA